MLSILTPPACWSSDSVARKMTLDEVRADAEADLGTFAVLVNPTYVYGDIHFEVFRWLERGEFDQLILLPRDHLKSHCLAVWSAWWITKHPDTSILYTSATLTLAKKQLYAIKNILTSATYRRYWPEMVNAEENRREKWTETEIMVDHPARAKAQTRDATVMAASIDANTTGLHCQVLVLDDIVVPENAYTEAGRASVAAGASQLSSVLSAGGFIKACGTRYHPKDEYATMKSMTIETYDEQGNITGTQPAWEIFERVVEKDGIFLWPRAQCPTTKKWYGFNHSVLAKKRASYISRGETAQYYAQYYNNPNDPDSNRLSAEKFQYYAREHVRQVNGKWYFKNELLAIFAAMDVAYTQNKRSDYTAIAVVGLTAAGFIYILDLDRFKTDKYEEYYKAAIRLHHKWGFRHLRVESNAGANVIAKYMQDRVREEGGACAVDPQRAPGDKVERIAATLEPRYETRTIWHPRDGLIHAYEEEVILARPSHDDLKDAVAAAIEISKPPPKRRFESTTSNVIQINSRFGGYR